jgi:Fibronectin type III-like domain
MASLGDIPYASRPSPLPPPPEPSQPKETYTAPPGFVSVPFFLYPYVASIPTSTANPLPISTPFPYSPAGGAPGGNPSIWDVLYAGSVTVTNSGNVSGQEVVQLYVSYPESVGEPPRQLRGFEKVSLDVGESTVVNFDLLRKDLSYWDVVTQNWVIANGTYIVSVGSSSRDLRVQQSIVRG